MIQDTVLKFASDGPKKTNNWHNSTFLILAEKDLDPGTQDPTFFDYALFVSVGFCLRFFCGGGVCLGYLRGI